jgi:hypothetical protein
MPLHRSESQRAVDVALEGSNVVLTIRGCLDAAVGVALVEAATTAVGDQAARVDIDLRSLTGYTDEGADSLVACRELAADLPDGLHYCTGQGPGREALLAAYAEH